MIKRKLWFWYIIFAIVAWIGLLSPLGIWIVLNFDKYVINKSGVSVTIGGILAVLYIVLLLKFGLKRFGRVFWMTMLLAVVYFLNTIIVDALPIVFFAWLGVLLFSILEKPMNHFKKKLDLFNDEEIRVVARKSNEQITKTSGRC